MKGLENADSCPVCARVDTLEMDKTYSRYRVRCSKRLGGCGYAVKEWKKDKQEALKLWGINENEKATCSGLDKYPVLERKTG